VHPHADFGNMHCMNADLSALLHLLQNLIRIGTIAEVKGAKVRVRLGPTLTTEWLKWATRRAGSTRTWSAPTVGEQVIVFSPGGDLTRGVILPALYSREFDAPESSDSIHITHYPDGAVVQYDHAAHALTALLPGGTATITADKVTSNAPSTICTGDLTVMKNLIVMQSATVSGATALNGGLALAVQGTVKISEDVLAGCHHTGEACARRRQGRRIPYHRHPDHLSMSTYRRKQGRHQTENRPVILATRKYVDDQIIILAQSERPQGRHRHWALPSASI
jgi:phage baseplate assembly protein V